MDMGQQSYQFLFRQGTGLCSRTQTTNMLTTDHITARAGSLAWLGKASWPSSRFCSVPELRHSHGYTRKDSQNLKCEGLKGKL
jgi:hypothetical protein